jgi:hypothetical protein
MNRLKTLTVHPFLMGIYPALALYAVNADQLEFLAVFRSLAIVSLVTAVLLFLLKLARVRWQRGGLAISITYALFFSFGHVYLAVNQWKAARPLLGQMSVLMALWSAAWILSVWAVIRLLKSLDGMTLFLNVVTLFLTASTILTLTFNAFTGRPSGKVDLFPLPQSNGGVALEQKPDIYYVILDGYAREDLLQEIFSYDNSELIRFLESRGFYVAKRSTSNYGQTAVSLASSLNFDYINSFAESVGKDSANYGPLHDLIQNNRARRFLERQGYHFVSFETGYSITEIQDSDTYIAFGIPLNNFEMMLLQNSAAVVWLDQSFNARYRDRITGGFDRLGDLSGVPSPKFVFAHTMAAHAPYVFKSNGQPLETTGSQVVHDAGEEIHAHIEVYTGQITYINRLIEETVDEILNSSEREPVIILQADHGSAVYMDWRSRDRTCMHERMSIFNAYYLPGGKTNRLYPEITPVNTFRVVFDAYFDTRLGLLEDKNYYSIWERPYEMFDVTSELDLPCSQAAGE